MKTTKNERYYVISLKLFQKQFCLKESHTFLKKFLQHFANFMEVDNPYLKQFIFVSTFFVLCWPHTFFFYWNLKILSDLLVFVGRLVKHLTSTMKSNQVSRFQYKLTEINQKTLTVNWLPTNSFTLYVYTIDCFFLVGQE